MTDTGPHEPQLGGEPDPPRTGYVDTPSEVVPPPASKPGIDAWTIVLGIIGGALLGTGVTLAVLGFAGVFEEPPPVTNPPPPVLTLPPPTSAPPVVVEEGNATEVALRAIPSIVAVEVPTAFGLGGGSGVVYSEDGYIITNDHVIAGSDEYVVVFADGGRWDAELIGTDPLTDLAVLRVGRTDLTPIGVGSSGELTIGERAIAVGNPLALEGGPSVTYGIISALNRTLDVEANNQLYGLIQTDAPITRGSSGGALVDSAARLIGITTAIAVSDVGAEGLGFAIPVDLAIGIANDLIEHGEIRHAMLGIRGNTATANQDGASYPVGVLVEDFSTPSPFEAGGGRINDVITAIDAVPVTTMDALLTELRRKRADHVVTVSVRRADAETDLAITLGELS